VTESAIALSRAFFSSLVSRLLVFEPIAGQDNPSLLMPEGDVLDLIEFVDRAGDAGRKFNFSRPLLLQFTSIAVEFRKKNTRLTLPFLF
jgi:hypothetical protein